MGCGPSKPEVSGASGGASGGGASGGGASGGGASGGGASGGGGGASAHASSSAGGDKFSNQPIHPDYDAKFLKNGEALIKWYKDGNDSRVSYGEEKKHGKESMEWAIKCLTQPQERNRNYLKVKETCRKLFAQEMFCSNLEYLLCFQPLHNAIHDYLMSLGEPLKKIYSDDNLATVLGDQAINNVLKWHPTLANESQLRQTLVIPIKDGLWDFDHFTNMHERGYTMLIMLVAIAVDKLFQEFVQDNVGDGQVHEAPVKSYLRMVSKMYSNIDYRYFDKPRGAFNLDVCRNLVVVDSPQDLVNTVHQLCSAFGGCAKLKNLFSLNEEEREERYHLLSVMLIFEFDVGMTYGQLRKDPRVKEIWKTYEGHPDGERKEPWAKVFAAASNCIHSDEMTNEPVKILCEVQVMLNEYFVVRQKMHESYRVVRAANGENLWLEFSRSLGLSGGKEDDATSLKTAVFRGQLTVAKKLHANGANINGDNILFVAAQEGHTEVLMFLVDQPETDLNRARSNDGTTALIQGCVNGHNDCVSVLLDKGADIEKPMTDGHTAFNMSCSNGHLDVVKMLVARGAKTDSATTTGVTALISASQRGYADVMEYLISIKAVDINARNNEGLTALHWACFKGHLACARVLLDAGADRTIVDDFKKTPKDWAVNKGFPAVAALFN